MLFGGRWRAFFGAVTAAIVALFAVRLHRGYHIVQSMRNHADSVSVEALMASDEWKELQSKLEGFSQAPAFILFNSFALPMTLNWLCNTADWPAVHQRLVLVTLDDKSRDIITALWPHIVVFHWPHVKQLQERFSAGDFSYQLIFLLRTNIIRAVLRTNRPIWMLQQDTFWRGNLFEMNLEQQYENADVLLDQMGYVDDGPRAGWTNGANWFIRPTEISKRLFDDIAWYQTNMYTQDTGVINLRCHSQSSLNCSFIPYKYVTGWEWVYGSQERPPYCIQMDGENNASGKAEQMRQYGFWFLEEPNQSCNMPAVGEAKKQMLQGNIPRVFSLSKLEHKTLLVFIEFFLKLPFVGIYIRRYTTLLFYYLKLW